MTISKLLYHSPHTAKATNQDEFYTQFSESRRSCGTSSQHVKNKTVLCNCDDPKVSNFFHFFAHNFEKLKLLSTYYKTCDADLFSTDGGNSEGSPIEANQCR